MYIVDKENNKLIRAQECSFKKHNLRERQDLQEWIDKEPSVFGEELIIIQKEFAGFADTRERLDLLALDKKGRLVVIENKLDDSGRDVTWQAIKYASYCSSLKTDDIISVFQEYLGSQGDAEKNIMEFLGINDRGDLKLNPGENTQRIFLVAAKFQKEVTSSVLWLRNFNIDISCFKVTPCEFNNEIIIDFDQIIPLPETKDYQIKIADKEQEEAKMAEATLIRHNGRKVFWSEFIDYCDKHKGLFSASKATEDGSMTKSIKTIHGGMVGVVINKDCCRTEVYLDGDKETNKRIFDILHEKKDELMQIFPKLEWERLDNNKASRIRLDKNYSYQNDTEKEMIFSFFLETSNRMMDVFTKMGQALNLEHK